MASLVTVQIVSHYQSSYKKYMLTK